MTRNTLPHPDQAVFDACALWAERMEDARPLWAANASDAELQPYLNRLYAAERAIADTPATTLDGLMAKAAHALRNDPDDILDDKYDGQRLVKKLLRELVALHVPARADQNLIDLCRRCVEALAANEAIYDAVPRGVDISDEVAEQASTHYDEQVVPLLNEIERTPAKTFEEVVAKARIWMSDRVQLSGETHIDSACIQFLIDLSALDLVPEVPEAPYHKPAAKADVTQEAA